MEELKGLVVELKRNGDKRWEALQALLDKPDTLIHETPIGKIVVNQTTDIYPTVDVTLLDADGEEYSLISVSVEYNELDKMDVSTRVWIGTDEDYYCKHNHRIMEQMLENLEYVLQEKYLELLEDEILAMVHTKIAMDKLMDQFQYQDIIYTEGIEKTAERIIQGELNLVKE